MGILIHKCMTKATTAEGLQVRRSLNWAVSRRGMLRVYSDALECGDWRIPYSSISEAVLFSTRQTLIPCYVLRITANGTIYQFGLNPGSFWKGDLPFPVRRERLNLKYSSISILVRLFLLACIVIWLWERFS